MKIEEISVQVNITKKLQDVETGEYFPILYFEDDFAIYLDAEGNTHKVTMIKEGDSE